MIVHRHRHRLLAAMFYIPIVAGFILASLGVPVGAIVGILTVLLCLFFTFVMVGYMEEGDRKAAIQQKKRQERMIQKIATLHGEAAGKKFAAMIENEPAHRVEEIYTTKLVGTGLGSS